MAIIFGDNSEFLASAVVYISTPILNSSKFVAVSDNRARIGTVSGTDITFGDSVQFTTSVTYRASAATLEESKFVVINQNSDSFPGRDTAVIGAVSGTGITFGTPLIFHNTKLQDQYAVDGLDASGFVVGYYDTYDSSHGKAIIGTISGTDITFGSEVKFSASGETRFIDIAAFNSSGFVVAYWDRSGESYGKARIGTVSGTNITFGTEAQFYISGDISSISIAMLNDTKFVVAYQDTTDSGHGTAKIGTINGTNITFGDEIEFLGAGSAQNIDVAILSENMFMVAYRDDSDNGYGKAIIGRVNDTNVIFTDVGEFLDIGIATSVAAGILDGNVSVVMYGDGSDSQHGKAKIGDIIPPPPNIYDTNHLFICGPINYATSGNLFIGGLEETDASGNLFINGYSTDNVSGNLFVWGRIPTIASSDLFICGRVPEPSSVSGIARPLDWLLKTQDYNPQIVGTFDMSASSAVIQVWDITNGQNTLMTLTANSCYAIGNTGRWGWSTANLPTTQGYDKHYFYIITSNLGETFDGQIILNIPEGARWIHPSSQSDFIV